MADAAGVYEGGEGGSGGASLAGYEYQIDVSVWLALDLVLVSRLTSAMVLEPASQEDLEAELSDDEPARTVSRIALNGYTLIVQVKRRGGDAWTPTTLATLLKHGSDTRSSAAKRLRDTAARYLLVTSAGLNGGARKLKVRRAGTWPKPDSLTGPLAEALPADAGGRVAVIANEDDERLRTDIDRLLTEGCRVPNARLEACRRKLRDEARARIAGAGGGWWRREEFEQVIREHGGYLASAPELEHYVHPTNWSDLRAAMRDRGAAMIIGQSGTGKTLATKQLYDELRQERPGLARVPIRLGPYELRDDQTTPPVLYDIEDPWGRFDFDPRSRPWNDQLARFFAAATPDRMIVATSRLDVAQESKALDSVASWLVKLEAEHYGTRERIRLYRSRVDGLPRELQPLARGAERKVLDELATPLEVQKFFDSLRTLDRAGMKNPPGFVSDAIRRAHQDSIESTVVNQIGERGDVRAAAVIWGLLKASDKLSRSVLRDIEDLMADLDPAMERGVSPLVNFFVAARNLRQGDAGMVTYYHPRVEAGVERSMEAHRHEVRHTLRRLIEILVSEDGPGGEWGAGAAARVLAASAKRFGVKPVAGVVTEIDAWLEARLAEGGKAFETNLSLAAEAGSASCNAAELARFLLNRPDRTFPGFMTWGPPGKPDTWYEARRGDPGTKPFIETFIRQVLPGDRVSYPTSLVEHLERLSPGLSAAFLDAATTVVHLGVISTDDVIAEGALRDLDGFETVVEAAAAARTSTEEERQRAAELSLDCVNEVYSDDYAQHLAEDDSGYTAHVFLKAYVEQARATKGWRHLAEHPHRDALLPYWLNLLAAEGKEGPLDGEELRGAFTAAFGGDHEDDFWWVLLVAWHPDYLEPLQERVAADQIGKTPHQAALTCLIERAPEEFRRLADELSERGRTSRLAELAVDLAQLRHRRANDGVRHADAADAAAESLPAPFAELSRAALALAAEGTPTLGEDARTALAALEAPGEALRRLRVELSALAPLTVEDDVRWLLKNSDDRDTAILAIEAAIRLEMAEEVEAALDHKFAHVSALALAELGDGANPPLPERMLAKASDRGSPVRKALVALLREKRHPDHVPALLTLAGDTWSAHSHHYGEDADYPIAQSAIEVLASLTPLPSAAMEALFAIALDTDDPDVRRPILRLVARTGGLEWQTRMFELAVQPGQAALRAASANALFHAAELIEPEIVAKITAPLLATRIPAVADSLALLLAWRGEPEAVRAIAEELATNSKRRVLILLLVWLIKDRDLEIAQEIAAMLPAEHPAVAWALGGDVESADDTMIADLGEPAICAQVLIYMRIKREDDERAG